MSSQTLEVRIDSVVGSDDDGDVDFCTRAHDANEPLLVVFSNDRKKKRSETKELKEIILHEFDSTLYDIDEEYAAEYNDIDYDYGDYMPYDDPQDIQKRDTLAVLAGGSDVSGRNKTKSTHATVVNSILSKARRNGDQQTERMAELYRRVLDPQAEETETEVGRREKRSRRPRRRFRSRRMCKRKKMYVNFAEINWDGWIIAPSGYQVHCMLKIR